MSDTVIWVVFFLLAAGFEFLAIKSMLSFDEQRWEVVSRNRATWIGGTLAANLLCIGPALGVAAAYYVMVRPELKAGKRFQ
jgi:uncharacterized membrane protein